MGVQTVQKVWKSGSTLCISVPRKVSTILGLNEGDYLQIDWLEIIKREDLKGKETPRKTSFKKYFKKGEEEEEQVKEDSEDVLPEL